MSSKKGMLVVFSAPSGCGKDTVFNKLCELRNDIVKSVSATTRSPRDTDIEGVSYYFKTNDEFKQLISQGGLLEYAKYNGEYYGTPIEGVNKAIDQGKVCFLIIEVKGAINIMKLIPDSVSIFMLPPSMDELRRRLTARGTDDEQTVNQRLEIAETEIEYASIYNYRVINDTVDNAAADIIEIINNELKARN